MKLIIKGRPITKKNSMRMARGKNGRMFPIPSKQFEQYKKIFLAQIPRPKQTIDYPVNVKAVYYMPTLHRVDISNLLNATHDLLVDAGVLKDDDFKIIASVDGSRVKLDREFPRVEITIERVEP